MLLEQGKWSNFARLSHFGLKIRREFMGVFAGLLELRLQRKGCCVEIDNLIKRNVTHKKCMRFRRGCRDKLKKLGRGRPNISLALCA